MTFEWIVISAMILLSLVLFTWAVRLWLEERNQDGGEH